MKTYPNKLNTFTAELDDSDAGALDLIKVKSVSLMKEGKVVRTLQPGRYTSGWIATHSFNKDDEAGTYEVHWDFSFNGQELEPQIDYIILQKEVKFKKTIGITEPVEYNIDPTLPHDLQFLTEYEKQ